MNFEALEQHAQAIVDQLSNDDVETFEARRLDWIEGIGLSMDGSEGYEASDVVNRVQELLDAAS